MKSHQHLGDNSRSAFDARFVEVCHPRSQKLDDIRQMVPHLQFNIATEWWGNQIQMESDESRRSKESKVVVCSCYWYAFAFDGSILGMTRCLDFEHRPGEVPEERAQSFTGAMLSWVAECGIEMSTLRQAVACRDWQVVIPLLMRIEPLGGTAGTCFLCYQSNGIV